MNDLTDKNGKNSKRDPLIQMALDVFKMSVINSRMYADCVFTDEQRIAQLDRIKEVLDRADYRDAVAYLNSSNKPFRD